MKRLSFLSTLLLPALLPAVPACAQDTTAAQLIAGFEAASGAPADPAHGREMFLATHTGGKPDTPSCTTCHTSDVTGPGETRTGKVIDPLAPSVMADRFTDAEKVEKWFGRNCNSVLGRECTAAEKADLLAWLAAQ